MTSSGERAQSEASRRGRGPAAQTEGEAALLRGGLPARRGRLPVLGAPLHPRLQETWVFWLVGWLVLRSALLSGLSFTLSLRSYNRQHLVHGGERGLAGPDGAGGRLGSGDAGRLLQLRRRGGFAGLAATWYEVAGARQADIEGGGGSEQGIIGEVLFAKKKF